MVIAAAHDAMNAIPVARIGQIWEGWQRANANEAAKIVATFTDIAIRRDFALANNWLVARIHDETAIPKERIRDYIRQNRMD
jgi:hypothetical protein